MTKVLIFLTNQATMGNTDEANGTYTPELTHAINEFIKAGLDYDLVSIKGGSAPLYGAEESDDITQTLLADDKFSSQIDNTLVAANINLDDYQAVYYPGGYGLLWDLIDNQEVAAQTAKLYQQGAVVGAVCHGPGALLPITLENGDALIKNKALTSFTREEEIDFNTIDKIPLLIEEHLTRKAGSFSKKAPWSEHVIVDGKLVTGQNPASAGGVGKAMAELLV